MIHTAVRSLPTTLKTRTEAFIILSAQQYFISTAQGPRLPLDTHDNISALMFRKKIRQMSRQYNPQSEHENISTLIHVITVTPQVSKDNAQICFMVL